MTVHLLAFEREPAYMRYAYDGRSWHSGLIVGRSRGRLCRR